MSDEQLPLSFSDTAASRVKMLISEEEHPRSKIARVYYWRWL